MSPCRVRKTNGYGKRRGPIQIAPVDVPVASGVVCFVGDIIVPAVIGLVVLGVWWYRCARTTLEVSTVRTLSREGILSMSTTEVRHVDVKQLHTHQTFFQRLLGVGTIEISSAGTGGVEISVSGLPYPERVVGIIHKAQDTEDTSE